MKGGVTFAFFKTSGISANYHKLSNIIKSDLTMISVSFASASHQVLSTYICPVCLNVPLHDPFPPRVSLLFSRLSHSSQEPYFSAGLPTKTQIEEDSEYLTFYMSFVSSFPPPPNHSIIFLVFFFLLIYLQKPLFPFTMLAGFSPGGFWHL